MSNSITSDISTTDSNTSDINTTDLSTSEMDQLLARGYGETRVRVRYAETDQMGVVYHANYLIWFEVGRVELMRSMGVTYKRMEQQDEAMIPVVEVSARYMAPARYDDLLLVRTSVAAVRGSIIRLRYIILRAADAQQEEQLLCEGESVHLVVGRDMKRKPIPAQYAAGLAAMLEKHKAPAQSWSNRRRERE